MAKEGLTEKVTLKQTSEESSKKALWILGHDHPRHRNGKYKGPNMDQPGMFRNSREASVAGAEGVRSSEGGGQSLSWDRSHTALVAVRMATFILSGAGSQQRVLNTELM